MAGEPCEVVIDGERCGRPAQAHGLCPGHYAQKRKGEPYKALRTARGAGAQVAFRLPVDLKTAAQVAADKLGIDEGEWWRRAGVAALKAEKLGRPAPRTKLADDGDEWTIPGPGGPKR